MRSRDDGDTRHLDDLAELAHQALAELVDEIRWKRNASYGPSGVESAGRTSGGPTSDPTGEDAKGRQHLRHKVGRGIRDLRWLVDVKLPEMTSHLRGYDDGPVTSDLDRKADVDGGLSAYRVEVGRMPSGRPDLVEALEAQRRRLGRGEGWGSA